LGGLPGKLSDPKLTSHLRQALILHPFEQMTNNTHGMHDGDYFRDKFVVFPDKERELCVLANSLGLSKPLDSGNVWRSSGDFCGDALSWWAVLWWHWRFDW
jgi:hypothetical protein